jgi:glyoxylase I family protein
MIHADPRSLVLRVDHVSFLVRDLHTALRFYVDALGCNQVERPDLGFPGAWLRAGDSIEIHLVTPLPDVDAGRPPKQPAGNANHVAFAIADHADALHRLRSLGVDVREGDVGIRQLFVQDPDGNVIELIERSTTKQRP